jgi:hypothetical protein
MNGQIEIGFGLKQLFKQRRIKMEPGTRIKHKEHWYGTVLEDEGDCNKGEILVRFDKKLPHYNGRKDIVCIVDVEVVGQK